MPDRRLTSGEKALLRPIFGSIVPYDDQWIGRNDAEWGGRTNSITLATSAAHGGYDLGIGLQRHLCF